MGVPGAHCIVGRLLLRPDTNAPGHTRDQDDTAPDLVLQHVPPRLSREQPCAIEIHINHLPPPLILVVLRFNIIHNASRGDKAVHFAKVLDDVRPSTLDARLGRYVAGVGLEGGDEMIGGGGTEVCGYVSD